MSDIGGKFVSGTRVLKRETCLIIWWWWEYWWWWYYSGNDSIGFMHLALSPYAIWLNIAGYADVLFYLVHTLAEPLCTDRRSCHKVVLVCANWPPLKKKKKKRGGEGGGSAGRVWIVNLPPPKSSKEPPPPPSCSSICVYMKVNCHKQNHSHCE